MRHPLQLKKSKSWEPFWSYQLNSNADQDLDFFNRHGCWIFILKTYSKWNWKKCGRCRTISGHIFANCINIFHKTEVQKVILRCLRSLYLIWFKSHGTKCSKRPIAILAKSETLLKKIATDKWPFYNHFRPFFADCMNIFHKTEVQAVIFRC